MSDDPDLTPDDVKEILRLIDESRFDEFELETPRLSVRFSRAARAAPADSGRPGDSPGLADVTSPLVGTLYRAGAPGGAPFVEVGDRVDVGTKLCIIEVMKLMNTVTADIRGEVVEICVQDGAPVQYGQVILRIRADD